MSKQTTTTIIGGAAGAIAFIVVVIGLVWFCKFHWQKFTNKNLDTGSSDPSALGELLFWDKLSTTHIVFIFLFFLGNSLINNLCQNHSGME